MPKRLTTEQFICRAKSVHGDRYDYSHVQYENMYTTVKIMCSAHGVFEQMPSNHLGGANCYKCGRTTIDAAKVPSTQEFLHKVKAIHGDKYDYGDIIYHRTDSSLNITCKIHGVFTTTPHKLLSGYGCKKCGTLTTANKRRRTTAFFIEKAKEVHGDLYDYSEAAYLSQRDKVTIICPIHGRFSQTASDHLGGHGCSLCSGSQGERKISRYLKSQNIAYACQHTFAGCIYKKKLRFDFYIPDRNLCIEYDGRQHTESVDFFGGVALLEELNRKDEIKTQYCIDHNIGLLRISYIDYDRIEELVHECLQVM